jgi:hypothetical protein
MEDMNKADLAADNPMVANHRRGPKMWFFYECDIAACLSSEAHMAGLDRTSRFRVDAPKISGNIGNSGTAARTQRPLGTLN